jgi:hypothetical protein
VCTVEVEISCLVAIKTVLTVLEEIRPDDSLEKAETCHLINYVVGLRSFASTVIFLFTLDISG